MKSLLIGLIRMYQRWASPTLRGSCRYTPSCSEYARQCLQRHGTWRGLRLTLARLGRCHVDAPAGHDPVPPRDRIPAALRGQEVRPAE